MGICLNPENDDFRETGNFHRLKVTNSLDDFNMDAINNGSS